jgi:hypothetical protein
MAEALIGYFELMDDGHGDVLPYPATRPSDVVPQARDDVIIEVMIDVPDALIAAA